MWAALAGARVAPSGLAPRPRDAALRPLRRAQARASCSPRWSATRTPSCACARCRRSRRPRDAEAFDARDRRRRHAGRATRSARASRSCCRRWPRSASAAATRPTNWIWRLAEHDARGPRGVRRPALAGDQAAARPARELRGGAHARNARRLVHAARKQDRRLARRCWPPRWRTRPRPRRSSAARARAWRASPSALSRELLRNFPKGRPGAGGGGARRARRGPAPQAVRWRPWRPRRRAGGEGERRRPRPRAAGARRRPLQAQPLAPAAAAAAAAAPIPRRRAAPVEAFEAEAARQRRSAGAAARGRAATAPTRRRTAPEPQDAGDGAALPKRRGRAAKAQDGGEAAARRGGARAGRAAPDDAATRPSGAAPRAKAAQATRRRRRRRRGQAAPGAAEPRRRRRAAAAGCCARRGLPRGRRRARLLDRLGGASGLVARAALRARDVAQLLRVLLEASVPPRLSTTPGPLGELLEVHGPHVTGDRRRGGPRRRPAPRASRRRRSSIEQPAVGVDAGAASRAARPADRCAEQRVARAPGGQQRVGGRRQRALQARRAAAAARPRRRPARGPASPARSRSSGGRSAGATATLTPMPSTAQPSCGRPSTRMPASLRPSSRTSLGHLIARRSPATSRDRDRRGERQQRAAGRAARASTAAPCPAGAVQRAALAPAARGLLAGGDERAVRRARGASSRARSLVESVVRRCRRGVPSAHARQPPVIAARRRARARAALARRAAVDRQRERRGRRPRRAAARRARRRRTSWRSAAAAVDVDGRARAAGRRRSSSSCSTSSMTLPKRSKAMRVGDELAVLEPRRSGMSRRHELVGVERVARVGQRRRRAARRAATGAKMSRPWNVADDGLEAVDRARDVDRLDDAAEALGGQRQQAVVGADEQAVLLARCAARRARRSRADLRVDDREVHARAAKNGSARRRTSARRRGRRGGRRRG